MKDLYRILILEDDLETLSGTYNTLKEIEVC